MKRKTSQKPKRPRKPRTTNRAAARSKTARAPKADQAELTRAVSIEPTTFDADARSVEAVVSTESMVLDYYPGTYRYAFGILLVAGFQVPKRVPLLDTHDRSTVRKALGSVRSFRKEAGKVSGTMHFSSKPEVAGTITDVQEGHVTNVSVGVSVLRAVEITAGQTATVQGKQYKAPKDYSLLVVTRWTVREVSLCTVGRDEGAQVRSETEVGGRAPRTHSREDTTMNFEEWLLKRGFNEDDLDEGQETALRADYDAEIARAQVEPPAAPAPAGDADRSATGQPAAAPAAGEVPAAAPAPVDLQAAARAAVDEVNRAEAARVQGIRDLAALTGGVVKEEVITRCISESMTVDAARAVIAKAVQEARPIIASPAIHVGGGDIARADLEVGLLLRGGLAEEAITAAYSEEQMDRGDRQFRSLSLVDLCRYALMLAGQEPPRDTEEMLRAAWTTNDLSLVLSNVAHKFVMQGFEATPATWRELAPIVPAQDFKQHTGIRLGSDSRLKRVGADGEVKHGKLIEEGEHYTVGTYAELLSITRQHFIDDNLGVLNSAGRLMGEEAMELLGDLYYTALLANAALRDTVVLFHATHANLNTGNALDDANLSTAQQKFTQQKNMAKRAMNRPAVNLLVPPELVRTGKKLLVSEHIIGYGGADANVTEPSANIHKGTLKLVSEARLSDSAFHANYSASSWYLTAQASRGPIGMFFLRGKQTPTLTRFAPGPDYIKGGVIFQVFHDAGAAGVEWRGGQKNEA